MRTRREVLAGGMAALCLGSVDAQYSDLFRGWPGEFEGERLRRKPPTLLDQRLIRGFPGRFVRFASDSADVLFRWTPQSTRSLGTIRKVYAYDRYYLSPSEVMERPGSGDWLCFEAEKGLDRVRVCERIADEKGKIWTDLDEWYEEAVEARSTAPPWTAVTVIEKLD